jgi:hypothetical protein
MSLVLPTPSNGAAFARMRVSLSGSTYAIEYAWNTRGNYWAFSMYNPAGARLVSGVPVVLNADLLAAVPPSLDRPPYPLVVANTGDGVDEPTLETLGKSCRIFYLTPEVA